MTEESQKNVTVIERTRNVMTYRLFPGKDMLVEVMVQLLVRDVDAQLLKAVDRKVLEAKNVQDSDRP